MNKLLSILILLSLLSCSNNKKSSELSISTTIEKTEYENSELNSLSEKQKFQHTDTEKEIAEIATSFHKWYIKNTNDLNSNTSYGIEIIKGENGKCKANYEPYFNELKKLNTVSTKFLEKEKERTKDCAEFIETIDWTEYENSEAYDFDEYCEFFYFLYWTQSQEETSGIDVTDIKEENGIWKVNFNLFYTYENEKNYLPKSIGIITVEKEKNEFKITEINWIEKE